MYAVIRRYVDEAYDDMSEESEEHHFECFIVNKPLRSVQIQGSVEQAEQNGELRPQRRRARLPRTHAPWPSRGSEVSEDALDKAINYLQKGCFN